jgi:beta-galactosidase beta subunit
MIIDTIKNAGKYFSVHPLFEKAFEFIVQDDLGTEPEGKKILLMV